MATNKNVSQQVHNVSINREKLLEISGMFGITETDFRVLLCLLTELTGYSIPSNGNDSKDPKNFKKIDKEKISEYLDIKKDKIKKSINTLMNYGLLEKGDSETVKKGYRFTF